MADFRSAAYAKYVSSFKGSAALRDDRARRHYVHWCEVRYRPFLDALPPSGRVLDLGCGSGYMLQLLASRGFRAEGVDISDEQVRLAREAGVHARRADAFDFLAAHPGAFDGIVALDFVEHFAKGELLQLLDAIGLALKPRGWLLIQTPNGQGLFANHIIYGDLTHMTILNPRSLRQALALSRFENITISEAGPVPLSVGGTVRSVAWPLVRAGARLVRYLESPRRTTIFTENMIGVAQLAPESAG